jgi:hypothetical protein
MHYKVGKLQNKDDKWFCVYKKILISDSHSTIYEDYELEIDISAYYGYQPPASKYMIGLLVLVEKCKFTGTWYLIQTEINQ